MDLHKIKVIVEAALLAAARPLSLNELDEMFALPENPQPRPSRDEIRQALDTLRAEYEGRGIELKQVGSGFRIQVTQDYEPWMARLWQEKPPRYSRALLETLAIIAYRQPITRGEIEEIRGVSVSANITRTLQEREWVKVVGHRDVPGKPALFGTTREFLDYFNLKSLDELPTLAELKDLDSLYPELDLEGDRIAAAGDADAEPAAAPSAEEAKLTVIEGVEEGETLH
jgi:segregation and condensation protein B